MDIGFKVRRIAIENNIPILTNNKTIHLAISSILNFDGIQNNVHPWNYFISQKNNI